MDLVAIFPFTSPGQVVRPPMAVVGCFITRHCTLEESSRVVYFMKPVKSRSGNDKNNQEGEYFCVMFFPPESHEKSRTLHLSILDKTEGACIHLVKEI